MFSQLLMMLMALACQTGTRSERWGSFGPCCYASQVNQTSLISTFSLALAGPPRCPRGFIELSGRAIQKWSSFPPLPAFIARLTPEEMDCSSSTGSRLPVPGSWFSSHARAVRPDSDGVAAGRWNGLLTIGLRLAEKDEGHRLRLAK